MNIYKVIKEITSKRKKKKGGLQHYNEDYSDRIFIHNNNAVSWVKDGKLGKIMSSIADYYGLKTVPYGNLYICCGVTEIRGKCDE